MNDYPKNAHATSAKATTIAAVTNQMSALRATRFLVGLKPMGQVSPENRPIRQRFDD